MKISMDFNNVMAEAAGTHGLRLYEINACAQRAKAIHRDISSRRKKDIGFLNLPYDTALVKDITVLSNGLGKKFENLVVLGIGGSSLGAKAVFNALAHPFHNLLPADKRKGARLFFCDNVDPDRFGALLDMIDLKKTVFNVITKSGATVETMAQFLVVKKMVEKKIGKKYKEHFVITTDPAKGDLRAIAEQGGYLSLPVPSNVGGRYSVFSAVGLLPCAMAGIDIKELLAGARQMDKVAGNDNIWKNPAYMAAVIQYLAFHKGRTISVIMPYSSALNSFSEWYVQLWAESLGKMKDRYGDVVFAGQTPVRAIGATDQHAQLQLFAEGPFDKIITFIAVDAFDYNILMPEDCKEMDGISYLGGHTMAELLNAERLATQLSLTRNNRINYTFTLPRITPRTIGQLLFMFEIQTAFAGSLFDVNPFDQPGVEEGKLLACGMMGRNGYEKYITEGRKPASRRKYII